MFARKKEAPLTPARARLIETDRQLRVSHARHAGISERIERLRRVIDGEACARAAVQKAIEADGGAELEQFAAGATTGALAENDARVRAAELARKALPAAEAELERVNDEVGKLILAKAHAVGAVLIEEANLIGVRYRAKFKELCELHDQLAGLARSVAYGGHEIALVDDKIQVPRFNLPSLHQGPHFSPYLEAFPSSTRVDAAAKAWSSMRQQLEEDPEASIELPAAEGPARKGKRRAKPMDQIKQIAMTAATIAAAVTS